MKYYKLNFNWRLLCVPKMHSSEIHNMPCSHSSSLSFLFTSPTYFFNCLYIFLIGFLYGINNRAVFTQGSWNIQFSLEPINVVPQRRQDDVYSELKILMCCENCVPCPVFTRYALLKLQPLTSETYRLCVEVFTVLE